MMVTREYKKEQKELLKKMMSELKEKAKEVKKKNRKTCRAVADAMNCRRFNTEWFSITSFEEAARSFIRRQKMSKQLFNECMEKVINPLIGLAKKVEEQQKNLYSLRTFPMNDKDSCYIICADIFKTWKPTEAKNGALYVNAKKVGKSAIVGVIVGSGKRIHKMLIIAGVNDEHQDCVMICNNTQWRNSSLLIVDLAEKMPEEAFSLV